MKGNHRPYTGRFAPSPTGLLHFGSLVAAVASYFDAKKNDGRWLLRIEDIDPPREVPGSADRIIEALERFGLVPDEPVLYQSSRLQAYDRAIENLIDAGHAFWCGCSRSDFPQGAPYPGTCRNGIPAGKRKRSVRLRVGSQPVGFTDLIQGRQSDVLAHTSGDFVIRRADGYPAYQLAVVVDDAFQEVSHVVRGADLLDSTARQVFLQAQIGLDHPLYAHVPLVVDADGIKLSKQASADPVACHTPAAALRAALFFLGHRPPDSDDPGYLRDWAIRHWDLDHVGRGEAASSGTFERA